MNSSRSQDKRVLANGISEHDALKGTNGEERITFEVMVRGRSSDRKLPSEVLESEGWLCEGNRLTLTVPKDALSSGNEGSLEAVHDAIARMKHLLKAARIDYDTMVISEASAPRREGAESVEKCSAHVTGGHADVGPVGTVRDLETIIRGGPGVGFISCLLKGGLVVFVPNIGEPLEEEQWEDVLLVIARVD